MTRYTKFDYAKKPRKSIAVNNERKSLEKKKNEGNSEIHINADRANVTLLDILELFSQ